MERLRKLDVRTVSPAEDARVKSRIMKPGLCTPIPGVNSRRATDFSLDYHHTPFRLHNLFSTSPPGHGMDKTFFKKVHLSLTLMN